MKVAIIHDQLAEFGGSERVLVALKKIFPGADVFTLVYDYDSLGSHKHLFKNWKIKVSWFGKIPLLKKFYSPFRFLTPMIWESFDFSNYDLVISSSGSWMSKGVKTKKPTVHLSYIHHPPRYLYGYETAIEWQRYLIVRVYAYIVNHFLRLWDYESSQRPNFLIANSEETRKRIQKFYRREAAVIYPPVNIPKSASLDSSPTAQNDKRGRYYLTVSRLARAKHVDVLIRAANIMKFKLKIVGTGRDEAYLKSIAGPTVEFLGNVKDQEFKNLHQKAYAFLSAGRDEEFGIALVEAMGYGLPVIAYRSGGVPEYVEDGINSYLFNKLDEDSLIKKIDKLTNLPKEKYLEVKKAARDTAEKFSEANFKKNILNFVKRYARTTRG